MPDYSLPPFRLGASDAGDAAIRRADAVTAALELARAAYLGGHKESLTELTKRLPRIVDNIQQALDPTNKEPAQ